MKPIKPSEISGKILTLLDESKERFIIVSPYMKISKWYKLLNKIDVLRSRRIPIEIYIRDDHANKETYEDLDQLGLQYKKIPHLHSKFYLNENCGIVTSMNLLLYSEINSLEIAFITENWEEYNYLLEYYYSYINTDNVVGFKTMAGRPAADLQELKQYLRDKLNGSGKNSWLAVRNNTLHLCTGKNSYRITIREGCLRISAYIVPGQNTIQCYKHESTKILKKAGDLSAMKINIQPGPDPGTLQITGQSNTLMKSKSITSIPESEKSLVKKSIHRFINAAENLNLASMNEQ